MQSNREEETTTDHSGTTEIGDHSSDVRKSTPNGVLKGIFVYAPSLFSRGRLWRLNQT